MCHKCVSGCVGRTCLSRCIRTLTALQPTNGCATCGLKLQALFTPCAFQEHLESDHTSCHRFRGKNYKRIQQERETGCGPESKALVSDEQGCCHSIVDPLLRLERSEEQADAALWREHLHDHYHYLVGEWDASAALPLIMCYIVPFEPDHFVCIAPSRWGIAEYLGATDTTPGKDQFNNLHYCKALKLLILSRCKQA